MSNLDSFASNSQDIVSKIVAASELERAGQLTEAIAVYQEILALEPDGSYANIATKAIESLQATLKQTEQSQILIGETAEIDPAQEQPAKPKTLLQKFYNLPLRTKQLATVLGAEFLAVAGVVGVGAFLIVSTGQTKLIQQAESELEVAKIKYNIKIDQMGFGFRGQSDNKSIIQGAIQRGDLPEVKRILRNEVWKRKIEFATLVDPQGFILANAGVSRLGSDLQLKKYIEDAIKSNQQIKTSGIISYDQLAKESSRFAELRAREMGVNPATKPDFLVRYTITPVKDPESTQTVGALISGDVVKNPIVAETVETFGNGYAAVYLYDKSSNSFKLHASFLKTNRGDNKVNIPINQTKLLQKAIANPNKVVNSSLNLLGDNYTATATTIADYQGKPIAVLVRGTSQTTLQALLFRSLSVQGLAFILALVVSGLLASYISKLIVKPLEQLKDVAEDFAEGAREARAEVYGTDEIGQLASTFNIMADNIVASEKDLAQQSLEKEQEAQRQKAQKEALQKEVLNLLLEIEKAQQGDLTVNIKMTEGAIGSIADAFNQTLAKLRQLLLQVQEVSTDVNDLSKTGEISVKQLSTAALSQAEEINQALENINEINESIIQVANSTERAAKVARVARNKAQKGDLITDKTVASIERIRDTVGDTSKKVKQLAESSQEIAQIVEIISGISEKTNLLAFNASIEAARAGEQGEGFRIVANEVRSLADRVTESTKDIQQLVDNIQQQTGEVIQAMETSTTEVVNGTELVRKTKLTLKSLADTSQEIDEYLQSISTSAIAQTTASEEINSKMAGVAGIAQSTSTEAEEVVQSFRTLLEEVEILQASIGKFRLQKINS